MHLPDIYSDINYQENK